MRQKHLSERQKTKHILRWSMVLIILLIAIILASARIQKVTVRGNTRYTQEEVIHMLFGGSWGSNSF
jgi:cell division septal protein FtsQ